MAEQFDKWDLGSPVITTIDTGQFGYWLDGAPVVFSGTVSSPPATSSSANSSMFFMFGF